MRITAEADAEMRAARSFAEAQKSRPKRAAEAEKVRALAAAERYAVDAVGQRQLNEAENMLSEAGTRRPTARKAAGAHRRDRARKRRPIEKIEGIKILHMDGANGATADRNVTDEVIDFGAPLPGAGADDRQLMKEIGIEGGCSAA